MEQGYQKLFVREQADQQKRKEMMNQYYAELRLQ